tara:strand:+ start:4204 stop:5352 length:1149 start_codon:yes stop_codon:yes gene_type:complete
MESVLDFDDSIRGDKLQQLALTLYQLPCFNQYKVDKISVIEAGLSQSCFYVKYDHKAYFAKYLNANSIEPLASQIAAREGLSPKHIYVEQNWLITEFLPGQGLDKGPQSDDDKLTTTLTLLARCHRIPHNSLSGHNKSHYRDLAATSLSIVALSAERALGQLVTPVIAPTVIPMTLPTLNISATIRQLCQDIELSAAQAKVLKTLFHSLEQNLANAQQAVQNTKQVLCHGDANFSNVMSVENIAMKADKSDYQLIDFECACIAPVEYDLAMLMAVNNFDIRKMALICACYQQVFYRLGKQAHQHEKPHGIVDNLMTNSHKDNAISLPLVTCYYDLSLLINGLWYFLQFQRRKVVKYKTLALKQMMLLALRHPQTNNVIDEMR